MYLGSSCYTAANSLCNDLGECWGTPAASFVFLIICLGRWHLPFSWVIG